MLGGCQRGCAASQQHVAVELSLQPLCKWETHLEPLTERLQTERHDFIHRQCSENCRNFKTSETSTSYHICL